MDEMVRDAASAVARFLAVRREHIAVEPGFVSIIGGQRENVTLDVADLEALVSFAFASNENQN